MTVRIYLTSWFLHLPVAMRDGWPRGAVAHFDRGRKGHRDEAAARQHYAELVAHGQLAVQAAAAADHWERQSAGLQHVELLQVDVEHAGAQLAVGLLDDLYATPQALPTPDRPPLPWRRDTERRPWAATQRVLEHWGAPRHTGDNRP